MPSRCTGAILAGGSASRFSGAPKGLERVGGRRIIDRVADALRDVTDDLLLIANDAEASAWLPGVSTRPDVIAGQGSVGGIHAALVHAATPVLVVAWDMPFVPAALLDRLRAAGRGCDVSVPESGSPRGIEPLCAWYAPSCVAAIERALRDGDHRAMGFHAQVRVARLPADLVAAYGDPVWMFMNVNTREELARAEAHARSTPGGEHRS